MLFQLTSEQLKWKQEVCAFLDELITPEFLQELREHEDKDLGPLERNYRKEIAKRGWNRINWTKEQGGLELTEMEKLILNEEFLYAGAPLANGVASSIVAPAIFRFGTDENKEDWLPRIKNNEVEFGLGYSEPNAGTDLASLTTKAILDGDEWVINGQKTWNTFGHRVSHQWLAVRTDSNLPKHKGISMFIVPNDAPGVTMVAQRTWGEHTTNEVFFDNVRVPKRNLIGQLNQGWTILTNALDHERVMMGETAVPRRAYHDIVQYCQNTVIDGELLFNKPEVRTRLAELEMDLEIGLLFCYRGASMLDAGHDISAEASMMKVFGTELYTKVADYGLQIFEMYGQLNRDDAMAPVRGTVEHLYRLAPFHRFGGGTNEVQRNIVAQRGLGLPRK